MATAPGKNRAAASALPWISLPAILGFSLLGLGGSILLTYTTFSYAKAERPVTASNDARVYEARAVPFDSPRENPAERAAISRALSATQVEVRRAETIDPARRPGISQPLLVVDSNRELRGFLGFGNSGGANNYLAVTGTSVGISAQSLPSGGFVAPDAETMTSAPVPEASTWMCGAALLVLVGARGVHARLHRKRRRE
ncbi:MAG TPA: hypothetical protein VLH83_07245 [Chthoniobacterales bacterium]|nr:hypothetical protein [Chthoniobacterales bacterium]